MKVVLCIHNGASRKAWKLLAPSVQLLESVVEVAVIAHSPANAEFQKVPIELVALPTPDLSHDPFEVPANRVVVGVLGVSTTGKGFDVATKAIELVLAEQQSMHGNHHPLHFLIQVFPIDADGRIAAAAVRLQALRGPNLQTFSGELERGQYLSVLQACDVVLMAHRAEAYKTDLSGLFFEGTKLRKTLVASSSTAMGLELRRAGRQTTFIDGDSRSLADTLLALARSGPESLINSDYLSGGPWSSRSIGQIVCSATDSTE